ncbi:DEAD/DEAH box helicase [Pseudomonas sp. NW5]|uniref:DEAD/DEAH box helicase n=1 Tax=Pseudomonas sp. NW5 TaxID=2934934 RepID=UPI0020207129|nr:DEAD/DEAH box helicase [Pseudomonas sp. NW5]MCL7462819.1 DEAD/DEAH box helicase [Pseudomonas sp. NW5]
MTFASLGLLEPLLRALAELDHQTPTPIQQQAIPAILKGRDLLAAAQTGTGKTAGFALPLLQRLVTEGPAVAPNAVRALILVPTRELAEQVHQSVQDYGRHLPLRTLAAYGGVSINPQMMRLRRGVDVLVATPGRLLDLFRQNAVKFAQLQALVLDEADRMLDLGFARELDELFVMLPQRRQTLLFSATFSEEVRQMARLLLRDPLSIEVAPRNSAAKTVRQSLIPVDKKRKSELFLHLLESRRWGQTLVFAKTRKGVEALVGELEAQGIRADAIHGDKPQPARLRALERFKAGEVQVLVATDVAARGLDIEALPQVVNFDLPIVAEDYVHRIGRTGRAGASGEALSLVCADEVELLAAIEALLGRVLARQDEPGFVPEHRVPPTTADGQVLKKPKKFKKPKTDAASGKALGRWVDSSAPKVEAVRQIPAFSAGRLGKGPRPAGAGKGGKPAGKPGGRGR